MEHGKRLDRAAGRWGIRKVIAAGAVATISTAFCHGIASAADVFANATYVNVWGETVAVDVPGVVNPNNGWVWFNATVVDGPLTVSYNYNVNPNASANVVYNGSTTVKNDSPKAVVTKVTIEFAMCPEIIVGSEWGGTTNIKLLSNANGGQISCGTGAALTGALANGVPAFYLYWCPFVMSSSGSGVAQTNATFGQPIPSARGPSEVSSIGHFADFTITDGDTAVFTAYTVAAGSASYMPPANCPHDINGDGLVDKWDLVALLLAFGDVGNCMAADLNGDGIVNGHDLGMLIGSWGVCPP